MLLPNVVRSTPTAVQAGGETISQLPPVSVVSVSDFVPATQDNKTVKVSLLQIASLGIRLVICDLATTNFLTASYNNANNGIGATLVNSGPLVSLEIDGVLAVQNMVILVKNQTLKYQNGIYVVNEPGNGSVPWVMTRVEYYDQPSEINDGDTFTVSLGDQNSESQWIQKNTITTVGTSFIDFTESIEPGDGLYKIKNVVYTQGGLRTQDVTNVSFPIIPNYKFIGNAGAKVSFTLPLSCNIGDVIQLIGNDGWEILQNANQIIFGGASQTTLGVAGKLESGLNKNTVTLVCTKQDLEFTIDSSYSASSLIFS